MDDRTNGFIHAVPEEDILPDEIQFTPEEQIKFRKTKPRLSDRRKSMQQEAKVENRAIKLSKLARFFSVLLTYFLPDSIFEIIDRALNMFVVGTLVYSMYLLIQNMIAGNYLMVLSITLAVFCISYIADKINK